MLLIFPFHTTCLPHLHNVAASTGSGLVSATVEDRLEAAGQRLAEGFVPSGEEDTQSSIRRKFEEEIVDEDSINNSM
jgi:hypothetical protein